MRRTTTLTAALIASALTVAALLAAPTTAGAATASLVGPGAPTDPPTATWVRTTTTSTWSGTGAFPQQGWFSGPEGARGSFDSAGVALPFPSSFMHAASGSAATELDQIVTGGTATDPATTFGWVNTGSVGQRFISLDLNGSPDNTDLVRVFNVDGQTWDASETIGSIPAGTQTTLAALQAQIAATAPAATINAYGVWVQGGSSTTTARVSFISWFGDVSYFTPVPTGSVTTNPITADRVASSGIGVQAAGFSPGETVDASLVSGGSTTDLGTLTASPTVFAQADGAGLVQGSVRSAAVPTAGPATLVLTGTSSGIAEELALVIDPTVVPVTVAPVPTPVHAAATFTG
jgi:hypothetical protein